MPTTCTPQLAATPIPTSPTPSRFEESLAAHPPWPEAHRLGQCPVLGFPTVCFTRQSSCSALVWSSFSLPPPVSLSSTRPSEYWFLPKGRKDVGRVSNSCMRELRRGYRAEFLPLYILTHAPSPPGDNPYSPYRVPDETLSPSICQLTNGKNNAGRKVQNARGRIPNVLIRERDTGMPDEVNYVSELVDLQTALRA
ncbi:hypothetical protein BC629DRAFT_1591786 [Irpex lacteus]|nr:hypothetical protein BC629DRAFT_1591786 [Irpex lacteus]